MAKLSNKQIEEKAIAFIKSKYKNAKLAKKGSGYDLQIGNKVVEVKGTTSEKYRQNIFLSRQPEYKAFKNYGKRYWLYRVFNVGKSSIKLVEVPQKDLEAMTDPRWRITIKRNERLK
jgi:hypothetical protein